jgi:hypothetical protein
MFRVTAAASNAHIRGVLSMSAPIASRARAPQGGDVLATNVAGRAHRYPRDTADANPLTRLVPR